jgi:nucleoid-associated protein YgaU
MSTTNFPPQSRYATTGTAVFTTPDGRSIAFLERRFLPDPAVFFVAQRVKVTDGDRLDNIAARTLGQAELYWRICDANGAMRPEDLTATPGRVLEITLPAGIAGPVSA